MKIKIYKQYGVYSDKKVDDGIFLVNEGEYIVVVLIENFDDEEFVSLEEKSKFHSENEVEFYDNPKARQFQLIFESLDDAKKFIKDCMENKL